MKHIPVMLKEVLQHLSPSDGKVYVDATFGNGGYSQAILDSCDCKVIAVDRDPNVKKRAEEFRRKYGARFEFVSGNFGDISALIQESADGFVFDIGVSSMQIDEAARGFSFAKDAPLDMRMSQSGVSAKDIVNTASEQELANLIYQFGEEKKSRQIAAKIIAARKTQPIETTKELAEIIYQVIHKKPHAIDPATRTFQALRIAVNDELNELEKGLNAALALLKSGGRLVVVSFHSLEDRIVKNFFKTNAGIEDGVSRYMPESKTRNAAVLAKISKAITPAETETEENVRSRSAKLRYAIKA